MKNRVRQTPQFVQFKNKYVYNLGTRHEPKRRKKDNLIKEGENYKGDYNSVDRISQLPDEILVCILSFLRLKEAAATSILSRRWQYLWLSTMNLNFDSEFDVVDPFQHFYTLRPELRDQKRLGYLDWVNRVLEQHTGTTIQHFRVCFDMDSRFTSSIDKWIQIAMNKRVQILELNFSVDYTRFEDYYTFSEELLGVGKLSASKLKHLYPEIPSLRPCGYNIGFKLLKVLFLRHVAVTEVVLEYFLYNCPVLERLSVWYGTRNLVNLRVVGPSVALKYLNIQSCSGLKSIQICDAKLVSFFYRGGAIDLLLSKVPLLVEVSISERPINVRWDFYASIELPFTQLSSCLSQLEILDLDIVGAVYIPNQEFPMFANLKHLKLLIKADYYKNLRLLTSFMKACPRLPRLVLEVGLPVYKDTTKIEKVAKCSHNYIKVVEIVGYRACAAVTQHIMFLTQSIVKLEKIVIDPVRRRGWPSGMDRGIVHVNEEAVAREHALQHLRKTVPSTVEFVCL